MTKPRPLGKRAVDDGMKEEVIARLLAVWKANPSLRFTQLLGNVYHHGDPYYREDYDMVSDVEEYYSRDHAGKFADELCESPDRRRVRVIPS